MEHVISLYGMMLSILGGGEGRWKGLCCGPYLMNKWCIHKVLTDCAQMRIFA